MELPKGWKLEAEYNKPRRIVVALAGALEAFALAY